MSNSATDSTSRETDESGPTRMPGVFAKEIPAGRFGSGTPSRSESGPEDRSEAGMDSEDPDSEGPDSDAKSEGQAGTAGPVEASGSTDSSRPTEASRDKCVEGSRAKELRREEEKIRYQVLNENDLPQALRRVLEERLRGLTAHARVYELLRTSRRKIWKRVAPGGTFTKSANMPLPTKEAWARPLYGLVKQERGKLLVDIWCRVLILHGFSITESRVEDVRDQVLKERGKG